MKQKLLTAITAMLITALAIAQAPQGMNYQATVRDNSGNAITNHAVGFKFNIRQGSGSGTIVYAETQTPTSDQFGGVALVIGQGSVVSGSFSAINWASGTYFNEVLIDATGGTNYVSMGSTQLMSVPYALYANSAGTTTIPSTTNYTIKFNGVDIRDSSLNFVAVGHDKFITKTNYVFGLYRGVVSNYPSIDSLSTGSRNYTLDTISQSSVYVPTVGGDVRPGDIYKLDAQYVPSHSGEIYYVPLNSTPVSVTAYAYVYNSFFSQWQWGSQTTQYYQALPNNPSVTGFNLPNGFTVKYER